MSIAALLQAAEFLERRDRGKCFQIQKFRTSLINSSGLLEMKSSVVNFNVGQREKQL